MNSKITRALSDTHAGDIETYFNNTLKLCQKQAIIENNST